MSELTCSICTEFYDLGEHIPMIAPCVIHTFCKKCIETEFEENNSFTCPTHNKIFQESISGYQQCKDLIEMITDNQIHCYFDQNPPVIFSISQEKALCQDHLEKESAKNAEVQNIIILRDNIIHILLKTFKIKKSKLSFEMKRIFAILLSKKKLQIKLKYLNAIKAYKSESLDLVLNSQINKNFELNTSNFQIMYRHEMLKTRESWDSFIIEIFTSIRSQPIWYFTNVMKNMYSRNTADFRNLIEIEYMKANLIHQITDISCPICGKGFQLGARYPRRSLNCGHIVCYTCSLNNRNCGYCNIEFGKLDPLVEEDLFQDVTCKVCMKENPISFENLPYHSFCDCIYCETCIKRDYLTHCKVCLKFSALPTENMFKVSKKTLIRSHYMSSNILCMICNKNNSIFFSKKNLNLLCNQCFREFPVPERLSLECQRLDMMSSLEKYIQETFRSTFEQHYPNFTYSSINRKIVIILQHLNKKFKWDCPGYNFSNIRIFRRFNTTYPVSSKDRRALKVSQGERFEVLVNTNREVKLIGVIIGGRQNIVGSSINASVSINGETTFKDFTGKEGFVMRNEGIPGQRFSIILTYNSPCSVATGKSLKNNSGSSSKVTFEFERPPNSSLLDLSRSGPILGLIYSDDT